MRSVGTSMASAVAGVLLAHMTAASGPAQVPSQVGFRLVMGIGCAAALGALAVAAFLPARRTPAAAPVEPEPAGAR